MVSTSARRWYPDLEPHLLGSIAVAGDFDGRLVRYAVGERLDKTPEIAESETFGQ
jgi:hypothetical protein